MPATNQLEVIHTILRSTFSTPSTMTYFLVVDDTALDSGINDTIQFQAQRIQRQLSVVFVRYYQFSKFTKSNDKKRYLSSLFVRIYTFAFEIFHPYSFSSCIVSMAFCSGLIEYVRTSTTGNQRKIPGSGHDVSSTVRSSHIFANMFSFSFSVRIRLEY